MAKTVFIWDEENVEHIAKPTHAMPLTPEEVEPVVSNVANPIDWSHASGLPITFGMTKTSKYIAVVWEQRSDNPRTVRVVTAYPVPRPKRRR